MYKTILSSCLKCRKNTASKNQKFVKTKHGRIMYTSNCSVCGNKEQEVRVL